MFLRWLFAANPMISKWMWGLSQKHRGCVWFKATDCTVASWFHIYVSSILHFIFVVRLQICSNFMFKWCFTTIVLIISYSGMRLVHHLFWGAIQIEIYWWKILYSGLAVALPCVSYLFDIKKLTLNTCRLFIQRDVSSRCRNNRHGTRLKAEALTEAFLPCKNLTATFCPAARAKVTKLDTGEREVIFQPREGSQTQEL